jgi:hypothetical protein
MPDIDTRAPQEPDPPSRKHISAVAGRLRISARTVGKQKHDPPLGPRAQHPLPGGTSDDLAFSSHRCRRRGARRGRRGGNAVLWWCPQCSPFSAGRVPGYVSTCGAIPLSDTDVGVVLHGRFVRVTTVLRISLPPSWRPRRARRLGRSRSCVDLRSWSVPLPSSTGLRGGAASLEGASPTDPCSPSPVLRQSPPALVPGSFELCPCRSTSLTSVRTNTVLARASSQPTTMSSSERHTILAALR